jgi:hypothetical protein
MLVAVFGLPLTAGAQFDTDTGAAATGLSTDDMDVVLGRIINTFLAIITLLAVLGFIIAGIMFLTAGGNSDRTDQAKAWLTYSIIGLAVSLIGYIVVGFVGGILAP